MSTGYRRQTQFGPDDDIKALSEKLNREFLALERARAAAGSTTVVNTGIGGSSGSGGGSGIALTVRTLDGALVLNNITELVLNQVVGLSLIALGGSAAEFSLSLTTDLVPEGSTNQYWTALRSIAAHGVVTGEPTGFKHEKTDTPNSTSTLSFNDATLECTIAPATVGGSFDFWINGVKFTKTTAQSKACPDVEGLHYFYFDNTGTLQVGAFSLSMLVDQAIVAVVYWDATGNKSIYFGDERHGNAMSWPTHRLIHSTMGTRYLSGLGLGNIVADGTGNNATDAQFSVADGSILDEDLIAISPIKNLPANIPIYYRFGAGSGRWKVKTADDYPIIFTGTVGADYAGTRIPWNQLTGGAWQLTEATDNDFILVHYFATNDISRSVIGIQGQAIYTKIADARLGANTELAAMILAGLPFVEFHAIATVIFETKTSYGNVPNARIRLVDVGVSYVDWRTESLTPIAGAIVPPHNGLAALQGGGAAEYYHLVLADYTKVTTESFVNMKLTGYLRNTAVAAPSNPSADDMIMYVRKIAGAPNEVRYVTKDANGDESILHSYTY